MSIIIISSLVTSQLRKQNLVLAKYGVLYTPSLEVQKKKKKKKSDLDIKAGGKLGRKFNKN